ncbi:hypothetical protein JET18_14360 [Chryseobacterium sp. L7]|uniref:Lipoprotein n=1 Tax=Chryseobacterium endalhagicum TaxID=2797638 RepID=A0ABS1QHF2_9FLAO|nr:hypothetical protein [Chryseobacterium endalhagicum]MBL1222033.1 hypothetical protein [Chryseobacterium endalhagicum]
MRRLLICALSSILFSCTQKEQLEGRDISSTDFTRFVSTAKGIVVYESISYTEKSKTDTFKIRFSDQDWDILAKSFDKNQIYTLNDDSDIGERNNSISQPKTFRIRTNKRILSIHYNYFIGEKEKINEDKSKRMMRFMRTFDSLVYYKKRK